MNILNFFTNQAGASQRTLKGRTKHSRNLGMRRARFEQLEDRTLLSAGSYPDWYDPNVLELESFLMPNLCELYLAYEASPEDFKYEVASEYCLNYGRRGCYIEDDCVAIDVEFEKNERADEAVEYLKELGLKIYDVSVGHITNEKIISGTLSIDRLDDLGDVPGGVFVWSALYAPDSQMARMPTRDTLVYSYMSTDISPELFELYLDYMESPENYTFDDSKLQVMDDTVAILFEYVAHMGAAPQIEQLEMLGVTNITTRSQDPVPCYTCRGWISIERLSDLCMATEVICISPMSHAKPADVAPPNEADDPTKSYPGGTSQLEKDHPHFICYEISSELLDLYFDYMESPEDYAFDDSKLCVVDDSVAVSFASSYTETCPAPQIEQLELLGMTDITAHKMQNVPCRIYRGWISIERLLDLYRDFTVDYVRQISPAKLADAAPPSEVDKPIEADPIEKDHPEEKTPEIVDNQPDRNVPDKPNPPDRITHPDPVKIIHPVFGPDFPGWPIYCSPGFPSFPDGPVVWRPEIPGKLPDVHMADTINTDQNKPSDSPRLALQVDWCSVGMLEAGETIRETYNAQSGRVMIADNINAGNHAANVVETIAAPSQPRSYDTIDVIAETNAYAGLIGVSSRSYDFATGLTKIADGFDLVDAYLSGEQDDEFGSYSFVLDLSYLDG